MQVIRFRPILPCPGVERLPVLLAALDALNKEMHSICINQYGENRLPGESPERLNYCGIMPICEGHCEYPLRGTNYQTLVLLHDFERQELPVTHWHPSQDIQLGNEITPYAVCNVLHITHIAYGLPLGFFARVSLR